MFDRPLQESSALGGPYNKLIIQFDRTSAGENPETDDWRYDYDNVPVAEKHNNNNTNHASEDDDDDDDHEDNIIDNNMEKIILNQQFSLQRELMSSDFDEKAGQGRLMSQSSLHHFRPRRKVNKIHDPLSPLSPTDPPRFNRFNMSSSSQQQQSMQSQTPGAIDDRPTDSTY